MSTIGRKSIVFKEFSEIRVFRKSGPISTLRKSEKKLRYSNWIEFANANSEPMILDRVCLINER